MNVLFSILIILAVVFSIVSGRLEAFTKGIFEGAKSAVEISLWLMGIVSLWLGILKILENSGFIHKISRFAEPVLGRIFKNIPKGHPAISSITMNFLANLFGLGNAATPLGIKAMKDLKDLAQENDTESKTTPHLNQTSAISSGETEITFEMMLFIVINTASIQLIPFTVVGILAESGASEPHSIILPTIIATIISASCAIVLLILMRRLVNFFGQKNKH